jgi:kinesin family member 12
MDKQEVVKPTRKNRCLLRIFGRDDSITQDLLNKDHYIGLLPRSIKYLWSVMGNKTEKYFVKVSFLEIYNEQIRDLLNNNAKNLQIRWNQKQGFFVEDLLVIDCTTPQEVVEVLLEGLKNRKIGSHELNKDSSRSHCMMTCYIFSEVK